MAKQPDVWGEARLTKCRYQYEVELQKRFNSDDFKETLQASVRQTDQAALSLAFALNAASGGASVPTSIPAATLSGDVTDAQGNPVVTRTPPLGQVDYSHFAAGSLSLEPTELVRQLDVYLKTLNDLRRVNEGGDTADSPGYALNLFRIPVSVFSGHHTRKGYGAEVTFTLKPVISEDLLPTTTRNLVINDLTSLLALPLAQMFNNDPKDADHFAVSFWRYRARVAAWIQKFDSIVALFEFIHGQDSKWQADIDYLYALRPYLQFRFLGIAAAAEDERTRALSCLKYLDQDDSVAGQQTHPELQRRPLMRKYIPDVSATVSVSAQQFSVFLDSIEGPDKDHKTWIGSLPLSVKIEPAGKQANCGTDLGVEIAIPVELDDLDEPGQLVDRTDIPLNINKAAIVAWAVRGTDLPPDIAKLSAAQRTVLLYVANRLRETPSSAVPPSVLDGLIYNLTPASRRVPTPPQPARQALGWPGVLQSLRTLQEFMEHPEIVKWLSDKKQSLFEKPLLNHYDNEVSSVLDRTMPPAIDNIFETGPVSVGAPVHSGTGPRPLAGSQILQVYGFQAFCQIAYEAYTNLRTNAANRGAVHVYDINQYLAAEALSAYEFLSRKDNLTLWRFASPQLAQAIDSHDYRQVLEIRQAFFNAVGGSVKHTITGALAWAIIVDAARLNHQWMQDMTSLSQSKGCNCAPPHEMPFVGPKEFLLPEAHEYFKQYVLCRWPIITFSLDPVNDEQNVADVFSRRRDLQLAVAVAVATGNVSPSAAGRFTRRLELDMETIALNRTQVAFSYANDTFGWRFYPRVQSPDTPSTLGAFAQTLFGTANRDSDLKARQLEPGTRDGTAVVIMPSFVPYVDVTIRADWFGVTNPRKKELTMHDTMRLSRNYQTIQNALNHTCDSPLYRPGDIAGMHDVLEKLEKRMPLQTMRVEVPYQNTLGGFELFATGIGGLGPELEGWYGAPGIDPDSVTTLYLVGKRFSVLETRVIAGGRSVPFRMLSRNVLEITVPPGVQPLLAPQYQNFVDVQVAAPYGVSSHLLVPRVVRPGTLQNRFEWVTTASAVHIAYSAASTGKSLYATITPAPQIQLSSPTTVTPTSLPLNLTISEVLAGGQEVMLGKVTATATNPVNARLDVRSQLYVIDVDQINNLVANLQSAYATRMTNGLSLPANGRATWLIRGSVSPASGTTDEIRGSMALDVHFDASP
ncbi:MAG TPA: hypothetical protein VHV55_08070 [Pirellulales bacterium]|nr:hypothetical protein [Pirellulales bacterium]